MGKTPPFPKKLSNASPKQFFMGVLRKYCFFSKKIVEQKNIRRLISDKKGYIHFWYKMTLKSHSDPAAMSQTK